MLNIQKSLSEPLFLAHISEWMKGLCKHNMIKQMYGPVSNQDYCTVNQYLYQIIMLFEWVKESSIW